MQESKPQIDPLRIIEDDPLLTAPKDSTQEGEILWSVNVDGSTVNLYARDRAHLIAKLKEMYPKARLEVNGQGRGATGKKPNKKERLRLGGGIDLQPPMNRKLANQLNHARQVQANKQKGRTKQ